jgi:hypothetical protein
MPNEQEDLFFLRHFHPVFPVYVWVICAYLFPTNFFVVANYLLIFLLLIQFGIIFFSSSRKADSFYFFIGLAILFSSPIFIASYQSAHFHHFFFQSCVLFFIFLERFLEKYTIITFHPSKWLLGFVIALMILCLETFPIVLLSSFFFILIMSKLSKYTNQNIGQLLTYKFVFYTLSCALIWIFLLNPSFFYTGGSLKSYSYYAYRIFFAGNEEYQSVQVFSLIKTFISQHISLIIIMLIAIYVLIREKVKIVPLMMLFCGICYLIFISPFALYNTYLMPALGLIIFSTILIIKILENNYLVKIMLLIIVVSTSVANSQMYPLEKIKADNQNHRKEINTILDFAKKANSPILADGNHVFNFYGQTDIFKHLRTVSETQPQFYERIHYQNIPRRTDIALGAYAAIILLKIRNYSAKDFEFLEKSGYTQIPMDNYYFFVKR